MKNPELLGDLNRIFDSEVKGYYINATRSKSTIQSISLEQEVDKPLQSNEI